MKPAVSNKTRTIVIVISILLILGTGVFLYLYDKKKTGGTKPGSSSGSSSGTGTGTSTTPATTVNSSYPLKEGSRGTLVKTLQTALNKTAAEMFKTTSVRPRYKNESMTSLVVDGIFGPRTLAFVQFVFGDFKKTEVTSKDLDKISWT
jgi:hypothetical protein